MVFEDRKKSKVKVNIPDKLDKGSEKSDKVKI